MQHSRCARIAPVQRTWEVTLPDWGSFCFCFGSLDREIYGPEISLDSGKTAQACLKAVITETS